MGLIVTAAFRNRSIITRPTTVAVFAALLFVINLVGWFPGEGNDDSNSQYAQAVSGRLNDWHPPIMAWLWSIFRRFADGNGPMFSFQIVCYWLGFGLVAVALGRARRPVAAWGILGVALFPPCLMMNINILKDVGLAVTFLTAFGAMFWYRIQGRRIPSAVVAISMALLVYGTLVRNNAVFAVVPLLAYMIDPRWLHRPWRLLALSIPAAGLMVPLSGLFNHGILNATPVRIIRSLEIFDVTGIAFYSGDMSVFGPRHSFTARDVEGCFTPARWDSLSPWGQCRFFWDRLAVHKDVPGVEKLDAQAAMEARPNPDLAYRWVAAVMAHPLAYARHRLAHFGSEICFLVAPDPDGTETSAPTHHEGSETAAPSLEHGAFYLKVYDLSAMPALWLAIGAGLLIWLGSIKPPGRAAAVEAALVLVLSSLPYTCAYLVIGVGTDLRYQFWSIVATFTALMIASSESRVPLVPSWAARNAGRGAELQAHAPVQDVTQNVRIRAGQEKPGQPAPASRRIVMRCRRRLQSNCRKTGLPLNPH